jgi:hypothetical protein
MIRYVKSEAAIGFEPMNRGFADLRLGPLGYAADEAGFKGCRGA